MKSLRRDIYIAHIHRELLRNKSGSSGLTLMTYRLPINCESLENHETYFIHGPEPHIRRENTYVFPEKWHAMLRVDPLTYLQLPLPI